MEKRTSISASFNSKEIEIIDKLCTKWKISRGRLIKNTIAYFMINSLKDDYDKKYPFDLAVTILKDFEVLKDLIEAHEDYHALADNKKIGRPKGIKRKRGKPKDTGVS